MTTTITIEQDLLVAEITPAEPAAVWSWVVHLADDEDNILAEGWTTRTVDALTEAMDAMDEYTRAHRDAMSDLTDEPPASH